MLFADLKPGLAMKDGEEPNISGEDRNEPCTMCLAFFRGLVCSMVLSGLLWSVLILLIRKITS